MSIPTQKRIDINTKPIQGQFHTANWSDTQLERIPWNIRVTHQHQQLSDKIESGFLFSSREFNNRVHFEIKMSFLTFRDVSLVLLLLSVAKMIVHCQQMFFRTPVLWFSLGFDIFVWRGTQVQINQCMFAMLVIAAPNFSLSRCTPVAFPCN